MGSSSTHIYDKETINKYFLSCVYAQLKISMVKRLHYSVMLVEDKYQSNIVVWLECRSLSTRPQLTFCVELPTNAKEIKEIVQHICAWSLLMPE